MQISFFEEFPSEKNLQKLKLLDFPCKIYVAAINIKEFFALKRKIKKLNKKVKAVYWPVLKKKESYWISPFSNSKALLRIFQELKENKIKMILDLELPLKRILLIKNIFSFMKNKEMITKILKKFDNVVCAEYAFPEFFLKLVGLSYRTKKIKMFYSSMHARGRKRKEKILENICKKNKIVAIGVIARGIRRNEKLLKPEELERDLLIAKRNDVHEVIIYRLAGLNAFYLDIIKRAR